MVATAPSDGSHLATIKLTKTVSFFLLIPSRSTVNQSKDMVGMSLGAVNMGLGMDMVDH